MKLFAAVDLAPHRAAALVAINRHFAAIGAVDFSLAHLHAAKTIAARAILAGTQGHEALSREASDRRIGVVDLARMIIEASDRAHAMVLEHEMARQTAKRAVERAVDQHAIIAALAAATGDR